MKRSYITLLSVLMFSITSISAQNKDTQRADKHFSRLEYTAAAKEYLKLVDQNKADNYVYLQLAESYYKTYNTAEAVKWYERATKEPQEAETYYRYAQMLKAQGKYEAANQQMKIFAEKAPNDQRAKDFKSNPNYLPQLKEKAKLFDLVALDLVNSDKSDFGAILHQDALYFTSARNGAGRNFGWTNEPFLDIFEATHNVDGTFSNPVAVKDLNSRFHDGPVTLTADGNTIYFASESFNEKLFEKDKESNSKQGQVNLFKATKVNGKWDKITPLPFNSASYSVSNPSLSKDGKTLYFSSDMPGGQGGLDIWKVSIGADGSFGTPENLGSRINTAGNESFPFITADSKALYFASNGHQGFGGYDIFMVDLTNTNAPMNLGQPINSAQDDFAFSFNTEKNFGFISSNRTGVDNIYQAIPVCGVEILTVVTNQKTGAPLADAKVSIVDAKKNVIATERTNSKGEVTFYAECEKEYTIQASKDGYESGSFAVASSKGEPRKVAAALEPIEVIVTPTEIILNEIFFDFDKSEITEAGAEELDKLVRVMQNNQEMVIMVKSHTDNRGGDRYNMALSERRAKATVAYVISKGISKDRISGKGYGKSEQKVDCGADCTEEQHAENRRSEFLIVKK